MKTQTFETLSVDQLAPVTGGGIGSQIGGLFGAKGAQWGGLADNLFSMFKGGSSGGSSSGGSSSGGSSSSGGGFAGILGNLGNIGKLFSGLGGGGGGSGSSGGSSGAAPADAGGGSAA